MAYVRRITGEWELHDDLNEEIDQHPNIEANIAPHLIVYTFFEEVSACRDKIG